jgi:RHS repeat-associated protein
VNRTLTYDLNGSITSDGGTRTFEWDGANRLVAINYTGFTTRSEFTYDGLNRVAKIVEKTGSTINSTRKFVWCGQEKCEFRDATDAVTQRNFSQGQYVGTTAYFYTRDHLGSIREMFTGGGTVVARYDYDPYGRSTTVLGTTPTDFNFTGLYRHSKSNLELATYRAYDPDLGRWLSRDPIGEKGGLNLYGYVGNNSARFIDPLGLYWAERLAPYGAVGGFVLTLGGSIVVDAATGGLNLLATPIELVGGTALGGAVGYGYGSLLDWATGRTPLPYINSEGTANDAVDGEGKGCPAGELTPTGEVVAQPSTRKGNKGGMNVQEGYVDSQGRPVTRQTVYGPTGKVVHGPHYRPGGPKP